MRSRSNIEVGEGLESSALTCVEEVGGCSTKKLQIKKRNPFITIHAFGAHKVLRHMGTDTENIVAIAATLNIDTRRVMMEFKKLGVDVLIPATYNPRKDLKAGDKEFEKIKNS
ncbi:hypothetical protein, partial [Niameybacter sp.]|uniref:hypothetical protein n=1 Tax=Niameybacter sp. TaxID=2033640 RepID=UPI002FC72117